MAPEEIRQRVAKWLVRHQGDRTQTEYAADITAATGWTIDYTRLGRYMGGKLPVGRDVLAHLADYAEARDLPPVDLAQRTPAPSLEERAVIAAEAQADAAWMQAAMMRRQVEALERLADHLTGKSSSDPQGDMELMAWMMRQSAEAQRNGRTPAGQPGPR